METKKEKKERLFKEATKGSDLKMDEQIREATIRSLIKTLSYLGKGKS